MLIIHLNVLTGIMHQLRSYEAILISVAIRTANFGTDLLVHVVQ